MRMLNFYINRAGKNLSASRHAELEKAKSKLSEIIASQKSGKPKTSTKSSAKKTPEKSAKKNPTKSRSKKSSAK
jgi:tRNA(adenine34) deaminase